MTTFGIVVGGGPAPGINGVIGAATRAAQQVGAQVIGIRQGFRWLMEGNLEHCHEIDDAAVADIHHRGGSILGTSRANPTRNPDHLTRVVESLERLGVDHLISIGGDDTCSSARRVGEAAGGKIRVAHVPKTIDNDLPLPEGIPTFGYETARSVASTLLTTLLEDARTTERWYITVLMGRNAGHLALGAGQSSGATATLVAEEFSEGPIALTTVARTIEATIVKRTAEGQPHGVIVLAEGIGDRLDPSELAELPDLPRDDHGHVRLAELPLGRLVRDHVQNGLSQVGIKTTIVAKDIGYELRCAPPNAFDQEYTRDLGVGAVETLLAGQSNVMVTRQMDQIVPIPFEDILDADTGRTRVRLLNVASLSYQTARKLQTRLDLTDFDHAERTARLSAVTGLDRRALEERYT